MNNLIKIANPYNSFQQCEKFYFLLQVYDKNYSVIQI